MTRARWPVARSIRPTAALSALLLLAAACGQKPGTHVAANQIASGANAGEAASQVAPGEAASGGQTATSGGSGPQTRTVTRGGATGAGSASAPGARSGGSGGTGGTPGSPGAAGKVGVQGSDRTGVSADSITVGIHAPVTGAAPLPSTSFEKYSDLYWRWVTEIQKQKVLGRSKVNVLFRDDHYQPASARQVCRELAAQSFLLTGGGGTDQIQACGDFSNAASVPYFSAGVTENGLRGLPWYFAVSESYKQQGAQLAQYVAKNFPGQKTAMVVTDTPNFDDAIQGWEAGVAQNGIPYYKTLRAPKGDTSWYTSFGNELKNSGVKVVYVLTSPVDYLQFAQQNTDARFQYVGVGITMGLNAILPTGCNNNAVDGGIFFSPFPGLDWARQNVPQMFDAAKQLGLDPPDDLALALWNLASAQHEMFKRYEATFGTDLTREDFRALVEQQQGIRNGIGPELSYTPKDHFGARQVHVLKANCQKKEYVTVATFATGF